MKNNTHIILLILFGFLTVLNYDCKAQVPANNDCAGAFTVAVNSSTSCVTSLTATSTGATQSQAACAGSGADDDVWFSFTASATTQTVTVTPGTMSDVVLQVFSGACGSLTSIVCRDASSGSSAEVASLTGLSVGTVYRFRVHSYANGSNAGTFTICITSPLPPPSNDDCSGATALPCGTSNLAGTTVNSISETAPGSCASAYGVWYTFTGNGQSTTISSTAASGFDHEIDIFSGSCGSLTNITCTDGASSGGTESYTFSSINGTTYYVYVAYYTTGTTTGTFTISRTCTPPPTNDDCSGSYSVAVSTTSLCVSSTTATSTNATQSLAGCTGNADDDVWFSFTASSISHLISVTPGTINNAVFEVFTGTCAGLTTYSCVNNTSGSSVESSVIDGLTIGNTYFVRVYSNGNNTNTGTFSVCITTPVNPCTSPTNITSCGTSISTTFASGTGLYGTSACGYTTGGYEKIFTFTPATTGNYYIQQGSSFAYIDYQFKLVSAGCSSTGWTCVDDLSGASTSASAMALTAGVQYYILLDPESTAGGNVTFTINCPPTPPANNDCPGATPAPVSSGTTCATLTNGTLLGATASTQTTSCVSGNTGNDVWYSFVAGAASHSITINHVAGNETDLYHSVYAGACGTLGTAIVCSDPNNSTVNGLILGNTYYIRVYTYYSAPNANTTFSVCIKTGPPTGPCGNPANNDYCSNPATLTQGAGTFSSTTSSIYSADQSTPLSGVFCGSIENNSWYSFIATSATASFPFTSISGCTWNDGVQAQVYSVTTNTNGCCSAFTSVSNCYNPGTTSTGTVTATGLVNGQTYILMVDGWGGDVCNFTVSGWTAVGILPLELLTFVGHNEDDKNKIQWVTSSEKNTNFFRLEKSKDGVDFEKLLDYNAAGNSESTKYYNAFDLTPFEEMTYYRLKLFNLDGTYEYSNIITINNKNLTEYITSVRPNPTKGDLEFDVNVKNSGKILIEIYNPTGVLINSSVREVESGYKPLTIDLNKYDSGIYLLKVSFENSGKTEIQKIIKN